MLPSDVDHLIAREENRQLDLWGIQNHPDGTGGDMNQSAATWAREVCEENARNGRLTWADILREEFYEALAESDTVKLRTELVQVAAVCKQWIKAIDRREKASNG